MSVTTRHAAGRARAVTPTRSLPHSARRADTPPRARPATTAPRPTTRVVAERPRPRPRPQARPRPRRAPTRPTAWSGGIFHRRIRLIRLILVAALLFMVGRLVDVQIIHSGAYQADAQNESHHVIPLASLRGGIYARDGSPLALSVP